jgi:hypothetical protein
MSTYPIVKLNDSTVIPGIGYGVGTAWFNAPETDEGGVNRPLVEAVKTALKVGYTHIDNAEAYNNEASVGVAIRESGVKREDLYITSKVGVAGFKDIRAAFMSQLKKLGVSYSTYPSCSLLRRALMPLRAPQWICTSFTGPSTSPVHQATRPQPTTACPRTRQPGLSSNNYTTRDSRNLSECPTTVSRTLRRRSRSRGSVLVVTRLRCILMCSSRVHLSWSIVRPLPLSLLSFLPPSAALCLTFRAYTY